jgi:hypothetical protein
MFYFLIGPVGGGAETEHDGTLAAPRVLTDARAGGAPMCES